MLVLVLGGFLLMQQATIGVLDGKKETAKSNARQAVKVRDSSSTLPISPVTSTSTSCCST